jgi:hypothetical protein
MQVVTKEIQQTSILTNITSAKTRGAHVSIYIPFDRSHDHFAIRTTLSKLSDEAGRLLAKTHTQKEIDALLKPLSKTLKSLAINPGTHGVAFFVSDQSSYHTTLREPPPELAVVADSFHLKPLLHCISSRPISLAIAITAKQLRLFRVEGEQVSLLKTIGNEAYDLEQIRRDGFIGQRKRNKEITDKFVKEAVKNLLKDFTFGHREVAIFGPKILRRRLESELKSKASTQVFFESNLASSIEEMAHQMETALAKRTRKKSQKFVHRLVKSHDPGLMTDSLAEIAEAAVHGRIERLVIDPSIQIWGHFNRANGEVNTYNSQSTDADDCVIDDISEEVIKRGGEVVFFDSSQMENVAPYMATLRWQS